MGETAEVTRRASLLGRLIGHKKIQINLWRTHPGTEDCLCALAEGWPFCKPPLEGSAISLTEEEEQGDVPTTLLPVFPLLPSTQRRAETAEHLFCAGKEMILSFIRPYELKRKILQDRRCLLLLTAYTLENETLLYIHEAVERRDFSKLV